MNKVLHKPLLFPVKHPDEINEIFDRISYGKGASIIRMMDKFLTSDTFKKVNIIGSNQFRGSTGSNKEYSKISPLLDSYKYSSSQLHAHETDLIQLIFYWIEPYHRTQDTTNPRLEKHKI